MTESLRNMKDPQRKLWNEQVKARALLLSRDLQEHCNEVLRMVQKLDEERVVAEVCNLAISILKVVHECHDRAHDVLCAGEFVTSLWQLFRRVCASTVKSKQELEYFVSAIERVKPLLRELNRAVSDFKSIESFWQMLMLRAQARIMTRLKDQVNVVVEDLVRRLNIAQNADVKLLTHSRGHFVNLETFIYYLVDERVHDRNDEAINRAIQEIREDEVDLENIFWRGGITSLETHEFVFRDTLNKVEYGPTQLRKLRAQLVISTCRTSSVNWRFGEGSDEEQGDSLSFTSRHASGVGSGDPVTTANYSFWYAFWENLLFLWLQKQCAKLGTDSEIEANEKEELKSMAGEFRLCDAIVAIRGHPSSKSIPHSLLRAVFDARVVVLFTACAFRVPDVNELFNQMGTDEVASIVSLDINEWQYHPIHYAALINNRDAVRALINLGVHPNIRDREVQNTPLHYASHHGHGDVVECLLSCPDIYVDARNNHLDTPLMHAAYGGHIEVVKKLLDKGAMPDAKSGDYDAFLLAKYKKHDRVTQYIKHFILKNFFWYYMTSFKSGLSSGGKALTLDKPHMSQQVTSDVRHALLCAASIPLVARVR